MIAITYLFSLIVCLSAFMLQGMDGNREKRFYTYDQNGCDCIIGSVLLQAARPTPKTRKPALLYEYFGLTEQFGEGRAKDVKQKIVEMLFQTRPWQQKNKVMHQDVSVLAYNNDGKKLVCGGQNNVCISDQRGIITKKISFPQKIYAAVFHPVDQSLIVCSGETFHKLDTHGMIEKSINAGLHPVKCLVNADTNELVALDDRGVLKVWSLAGGAPFEKDTKLQTMLDLACHYAGDIFALVRCSYVLLYQRSTDELKALPHDEGTHGILSLAFEPRGNALVSGSQNGVLTFWQPNAGQKSLDVTNWKVTQVIDVKNRCKLKYASIARVQFHPRGHLVASLHNQENKVVLWDLFGNQVACMPGCSSPFSFGFPNGVELAMHPQDNELAIGYPFMPVVIWQQGQFPLLEQLLFKLILKQYLVKCIAARRKPGYPESYSPDAFINWMSDWFYLDKTALVKVWATLKGNKQVALIKTYIEHAKKVGEIEESIAQEQKMQSQQKKQAQQMP